MKAPKQEIAELWGFDKDLAEHDQLRAELTEVSSAYEDDIAIRNRELNQLRAANGALMKRLEEAANLVAAFGDREGVATGDLCDAIRSLAPASNPTTEAVFVAGRDFQVPAAPEPPTMPNPMLCPAGRKECVSFYLHSVTGQPYPCDHAAAPASAQGTTCRCGHVRDAHGALSKQCYSDVGTDNNTDVCPCPCFFPDPKLTPPVSREDFEALDKRVTALEAIEEKYEAMAESNRKALQERLDRAKTKSTPPQPAPVERHAFVPCGHLVNSGCASLALCHRISCGQPRDAAVHDGPTTGLTAAINACSEDEK